MPLNPAGEPTPATLHGEFFNDPKGLYAGKSWIDKIAAIQIARANVVATRTSAENVRGESTVDANDAQVSDILPVQLVRDTIDPQEWQDNCFPRNAESAVVIGRKHAIGQRISFFLAGSAGESSFVFTDGLKAQILDMFRTSDPEAGDWPDTRQALIDLQTRDGSRSEQLWGVQVSRAQCEEAAQYGRSLEPPQIID